MYKYRKHYYEDEINLYRYLVKEGKHVPYNTVVEHFGESVWIIANDCIKNGTIEKIRKNGIDNGIIYITKFGLKRYRCRYYFRGLDFIIAEIQRNIQRVNHAINTDAKKPIVEMLIVILATIIAYGIMKFWFKWF